MYVLVVTEIVILVCVHVHIIVDLKVLTLLAFLSSDPSLTPHNLIPVFQALTGDWEKISGYTIVPEARAQLFREKVSARDQLCSEAGIYYALYHHNPNWKELSLLLYRAGETEALQIARPHIQTVAGNYIHIL